MGGNKIKNLIYNNVGKISFNLPMYFASPVKWSLQGIWSPFPSSRFTLFPVTSTLQKVSLLTRRKYEISFANQPVIPFANQPVFPVFPFSHVHAFAFGLQLKVVKFIFQF